MAGKGDAVRAKVIHDHRIQVRFQEAELGIIRKIQADFNCSMSEAVRILLAWGWESAGYDEGFLYEPESE